MRKLFVVMLTFVFAAFFTTSLSAGGHGQRLLPFHGYFAGPVLGFIEDTAMIAARCPDVPDGKAAWAIAIFEGWGNATHAGSSYILANHCSYGFPGVDEQGQPVIFPDGTYGQGMISLEAANGDILLATYDNGVSDMEFNFMDEFTFVDGGTGRFTFASGYGVEMGSVNFGDFTFVIEVSGVISYKRR